VDVTLRLEPSTHSVHIRAHARCVGTTGVEMEALTAASVAGEAPDGTFKEQGGRGTSCPRQTLPSVNCCHVAMAFF